MEIERQEALFLELIERNVPNFALMPLQCQADTLLELIDQLLLNYRNLYGDRNIEVHNNG